MRTSENLHIVREAFERSPRRSAHKQSRILGRSRKSLFKTLKDIFKFHSYKLQAVQQIISERDKEARFVFCTTMSSSLWENPDIINHLLTTDEAHLH